LQTYKTIKIKVMKRKIQPDEVLFVAAATMGVTVILLYAISTVLNLVIYLIK